ncbi:MAG: extensin family protein [Myxococcota bacterium]
MRAPLAIVGVLLALVGCGSPAHADDVYPLDDIARTVSPTGRMRCPEIALVWHEGGAIRWASALRVNAEFDKRLSLFEDVVKTVAERVLGRAPKKLTHLGSFNCRRIARYPDLLSEHGLGNAVDVAGFVFPALSREAKKTSKLPKRWQGGVTVTVLGDWTDDTPGGEFLRALTAELEQRPDIFRVMLGPAYPGHKNHFHFDVAPYRLVQL